MADLIVDEVMLREPNLLVPGKKPVGSVKIDWTHSLTRGLVGAWVLSDWSQLTDLTGNNNGSETGTGSAITVGHDIHGKYLRNNNTSSTRRIDLGSIPSTNPLSCNVNNETSVYVFSYINVSASNSFPRWIDKSSGGSAANGWAFYIDNGAPATTLSIGGINFVKGTVSSSGLFGAGVSASSGDPRFFIDGLLVSTDNRSFTLPTTTTNAALLNWNHSTDREYEDPVYCIYVWDRKISDIEQLSIHRDMYQFLIPA